jgi:hypothetical protein
MSGVMGQVNPQAINVNDPGLITLVNKLQDVFTTVGVRNGTADIASYALKQLY